MANIFVKLPKRGDIVVKDLATKTPQYITLESFSLTDLDQTVYEIVGVVYYREGNNVHVVYKESGANNLWCNRAWWYLSGYTLDGTDRTGILSIRAASNNWASNIEKTISYNATTVEDFVSQLNTAFASDTDFTAQDWYANVEADGETIRVHCNNIDYRQCNNNTAKSGFTLTGSLPEIKTLSNMRRKHGGKGGSGAIYNMYKALAYFRSDLSSTGYNPNTDVTIIKRDVVCLPAYLGTSTYQSDHCKLLRETYGEGEEGWKKFMASVLPVLPTDYGNMGQHDGKARTTELVSHTFTSNTVTDETPCCKAAAYCYNKTSNTVDIGEFWLPTTEDLARLLDGVQYGTSSSRTADKLNEALYKIGGSVISNSSNLWSCCRCNAGSAWGTYGGLGYFFSNTYMCNSNGCIPVSLYNIA